MKNTLLKNTIKELRELKHKINIDYKLNKINKNKKRLWFDVIKKTEKMLFDNDKKQLNLYINYNLINILISDENFSTYLNIVNNYFYFLEKK